MDADEIEHNARALDEFTRRGGTNRPREALVFVHPKAPFRETWGRVLALTEWASTPVLTAALVAGLHAVGLT